MNSCEKRLIFLFRIAIALKCQFPIGHQELKAVSPLHVRRSSAAGLSQSNPELMFRVHEIIVCLPFKRLIDRIFDLILTR